MKTTKAARKTKAAKSAKATKPRRFAPSVIAAIDEAGILGIRAGARSDHRFTGVWPVVVDGRVFARSWTVKPDGWAQAFLDDPLGTLQIGDRQIRIRAKRVRAERMIAKIEEAYAAKYTTPSSQKYVRGFRTARRRETTTEFVLR